MPIYEYQCADGHVVNSYATVMRRHECPTCPSCGAETHKVILHAPRVFSDYEGYISPATGNWIEGKRARLEDLRVSGCRPYEPGDKEDAARARIENDKRLDAAVDEAIDLSLNELTS